MRNLKDSANDPKHIHCIISYLMKLYECYIFWPVIEKGTLLNDECNEIKYTEWAERSFSQRSEIGRLKNVLQQMMNVK